MMVLTESALALVNLCAFGLGVVVCLWMQKDEKKEPIIIYKEPEKHRCDWQVLCTKVKELEKLYVETLKERDKANEQAEYYRNGYEEQKEYNRIRKEVLQDIKHERCT